MIAFDWAEVLRNTSFFSVLDPSTSEWLVSDEVSTAHRYEPGVVILREGESGDSIFLIGSGSAEALLSSSSGPPITLSVMRKGETFGEMGFFERRPRSASVRARESCLVLEIAGHGLRRLVDSHPEVGLKILLQVSERLRSKNDHIFTSHLRSMEAASRAKDEFVAVLGHELRNPLAAIAAAIDVLNARGDTDPTVTRLREIITRQTRNLSRLVEDLLDASRLVSGKMTLHRQPEDLYAVAARALASFQAARRATQHVIALTGTAVMVRGDATRLEQVVANLLDNAVKYTPPGGRVDVRVEPEGSAAVLSVRDTGVGVDAEVLSSIFDLFVQGPQTPAHSQGGLGLGLMIVKRLVELHDGTVSASSPGPDRGSEFTVRLPRIPDAVSTQNPPESERPTSRPRHILIIEDNVDFRDSFRLLLESWGHHVEEATSGRQGLEILRRTHPEIVLVDVGLPDIDGYAVARAVRSAPGGEAVVLVAVTGYGAASDRRRAQDAGFDAHVTKPVSPEELATLLLLNGPRGPSAPGDPASG